MRSVCVVCAHYPPVTNAGSVRIESFVRALRRRPGLRLRVLTTAHAAAGGPREPGVVRTRIGGAGSTRSLLVRGVRELLSGLELTLRILVAPCGLFLVSTPPFVFAAFVMWVSRLRGLPFVLDVRDLFPAVLFDTGVLRRQSWMGRLLSRVERQLYGQAERVVTVTQGLHDIIRATSGVTPEVIPNGADPAVFRVIPSSRKNGRFTAVFHGNLGRLQDVDLLVRYATLLAERRDGRTVLWVIGEGAKGADLRHRLRGPAFEGVLELEGWLPQEKLAERLNQAHVGISPRTGGALGATAFPVKVYEYLACGLPVVVSPQGEAGRIVEENGAGSQISDGSLEELDRAVESLRTDPGLYAARVRAAAELSRRFDRGVPGERLAELVAGIAEGRT